MSWRKKISLMLMFSGAFLEMTFGILRAVAVLKVSSKLPSPLEDVNIMLT